eukprot:756413-Hanusia_phi.AAC.3
MIDEAHLILLQVGSCRSSQACMPSDAYPDFDRVLHHHPQPSRLRRPVDNQLRHFHPLPAVDALGKLQELRGCPGLGDVPACNRKRHVEGAGEGPVSVARREAFRADEAVAGAAAAEAPASLVAHAVGRGDGAAERGCLAVGHAAVAVQPADLADLADAVAADSAALDARRARQDEGAGGEELAGEEAGEGVGLVHDPDGQRHLDVDGVRQQPASSRGGGGGDGDDLEEARVDHEGGGETGSDHGSAAAAVPVADAALIHLPVVAAVPGRVQLGRGAARSGQVHHRARPVAHAAGIDPPHAASTVRAQVSLTAPPVRIHHPLTAVALLVEETGAACNLVGAALGTCPPHLALALELGVTRPMPAAVHQIALPPACRHLAVAESTRLQQARAQLLGNNRPLALRVARGASRLGLKHASARARAPLADEPGEARALDSLLADLLLARRPQAPDSPRLVSPPARGVALLPGADGPGEVGADVARASLARRLIRRPLLQLAERPQHRQARAGPARHLPRHNPGPTRATAGGPVSRVPLVGGTCHHAACLPGCWLRPGVAARVILHGPVTVHALHRPRLAASSAARRALAPCSRPPAEGGAGHVEAGLRGRERRELEGQAVGGGEKLRGSANRSHEISVDLRAVLDGLEDAAVVDCARAVLAAAQLVEEARAELASSVHEEREVPPVAPLLPPVLAQRVLAAVLCHGAHARVGVVLHGDHRNLLPLAPHAGDGSRAVAQPACSRAGAPGGGEEGVEGPDGEGLAVVGAGGAGDGQEVLVGLLRHLGEHNLELAGVRGGEREERDPMLQTSAVRQVPEGDLHKLPRAPAGRVPSHLLPLPFAPHVPCSWGGHGGRAEEALLEEGEEGARGVGEVETGQLQLARPPLEERQQCPVLVRLSTRLARVLQRPPAAVLSRCPDAGEVHPGRAVGQEAGGVEAGEEGAVDVAHARGPVRLDELAGEGGGE